jgi:hypothetical protein
MPKKSHYNRRQFLQPSQLSYYQTFQLVGTKHFFAANAMVFNVVPGLFQQD